jgi:hypothetical protein
MGFASVLTSKLIGRDEPKAYADKLCVSRSGFTGRRIDRAIGEGSIALCASTTGQLVLDSPSVASLVRGACIDSPHNKSLERTRGR